MSNKTSEIVIYKTKSGSIEFRADIKKETLWATQAQMAAVFGVKPQAITKHLNNIYLEKELSRPATCSKMEQVRKEGSRMVKRQVEVYNLDAVISVGYRINSKTGTKFRQWATKVLRKHVIDGFTINKKHLAQNYDDFLQAVEDVKKLLPSGGKVKAEEILELVKMFAGTWFSLDAYDKNDLPKEGVTRKQAKITTNTLLKALKEFKVELQDKKQASTLFCTEKETGSIAGIIGNILQSFDGKDVYPTLEEKAAHLLYFMVKNHPFIDGNKRSGAFAFVWFLRQMNILDIHHLTSEALTVLTLLIAESHPKDKEKMIGLILMLLK